MKCSVCKEPLRTEMKWVPQGVGGAFGKFMEAALPADVLAHQRKHNQEKR